MADKTLNTEEITNLIKLSLYDFLMKSMKGNTCEKRW